MNKKFISRFNCIAFTFTSSKSMDFLLIIFAFKLNFECTESNLTDINDPKDPNECSRHFQNESEKLKSQVKFKFKTVN